MSMFDFSAYILNNYMDSPETCESQPEDKIGGHCQAAYCILRRISSMLTLSWGAQPRRTVWASEGPAEGTVFPPGPEDLSQMLRLSKSWGVAHPELEKLQPHKAP